MLSLLYATCLKLLVFIFLSSLCSSLFFTLFHPLCILSLHISFSRLCSSLFLILFHPFCILSLHISFSRLYVHLYFSYYSTPFVSSPCTLLSLVSVFIFISHIYLLIHHIFSVNTTYNLEFSATCFDLHKSSL